MNHISFTEELIPYLLRTNEWVTVILLCCFMATAYILSRDKQLIIQRIRQLFFSHEHGRNLDISFQRHLLLLILQNSLLIGILLTYCNIKHSAINPIEEYIPTILGYYSLLAILYCISKWIIYNFINWIFFERRANGTWIDSYFLIISMLAFLLFPATLLIVYLNLPIVFCYTFFAILLILVYLLLIFKAFCTFFKGLHGLFYLFLYFCTLEILPAIIIWKGMESANSILT